MRTWALTRFPNWFTKGEAAEALHIDKEKISSFHTLLTDIRKRDLMTVEARHVNDGLWEYRVWPKGVTAGK